MRGIESRHARGLVHTAALHPDEPVFDHIDLTDAVASGNGIQFGYDSQRREGAAVDADRQTGLEGDRHRFDPVGSLLRRDGHSEFDEVDAADLRILEPTGLVTDMQAVLIRAVRPGDRGLDRDAARRAIGDHLRASGKHPAKALDTPGSDDPNLGIEGLRRQLKAALIVSLARRTVRVDFCSDLAGYAQARFRDQGTGDGRAKKINTLVLRLPLQYRESEVEAKLFAGVYDLRRAGADIARFLENGLPVFARLPQIDIDGMKVISFVDQPSQDNRRIQPAGIGEHDLFFRHGRGTSRQTSLSETDRRRHNRDSFR